MKENQGIDMKTYICTGIGDMMSLDTVISPEKKESISEIYWACRFGKNLIPLFERISQSQKTTCY